jgi:hypothetical protein
MKRLSLFSRRSSSTNEANARAVDDQFSPRKEVIDWLNIVFSNQEPPVALNLSLPKDEHRREKEGLVILCCVFKSH